jgi:hypothetical protein
MTLNIFFVTDADSDFDGFVFFERLFELFDQPC